MSDLEVGHVGFSNCSQNFTIYCTDADRAIKEIHHLFKVKGGSFKMEELKKNKIEQIGMAVKNLLEQIDVEGFHNSSGCNLKETEAYVKLKNLTEEKDLNKILIVLNNGEELLTETDMSLPGIRKDLLINKLILIGNVLIDRKDIQVIREVKS